jgi:hypothetical protein
MMTLLTTARRRISSLLLAGLLIGVLSLAPWSAQSAAASHLLPVETFSLTSGGGVYQNYRWQWVTIAKAEGTYWKGWDGRGNISGTLCDTAADRRGAALKIEFGSGAYYNNGRTETVRTTATTGSCASFSFNSQYTSADLSIGTCASGWCSWEPKKRITFR